MYSLTTESAAFDACMMFSALKRHFNSKSYNYIKYEGKVRLSYESFIKLSERRHYHKLSRIEDLENFIIANLIINSDIWVLDLFNDRAKKNYIEWKKRNNSLTYSFTADIKYISAKEKSLKEVLRVDRGQHPLLLTYYLETKISPETLLIINELTRVFSSWTRDLDDNVLWPDIRLRLEKYHSFFRSKYQASYFGDIIKDVLGKD